MLKKIVNGIEVICDPKEETAILAEWQANDPTNLPVKKAVTLIDLDTRLKALEARIAVNGGAK